MDIHPSVSKCLGSYLLLNQITMLKSILKLEGVKKLEKTAQNDINGGGGGCTAFCRDDRDCRNFCGLSIYTCSTGTFGGICEIR